MSNKFLEIRDHVVSNKNKLNYGANKSKGMMKNNQASFSKAIEFFKQKNKKPQKPVVKKVVLPKVEEDVLISYFGYKLDRNYINPKFAYQKPENNVDLTANTVNLIKEYMKNDEIVMWVW